MKVILIWTCFMIGFQVQVFACNCAEISSIKEEIEQSNIVFIGKVLKKEHFTVITDTLNNSSRSFIKYYIEVEKLYKGKMISNPIEIVSELSDSYCGFIFRIGQSYIIYASNSISYTKNKKRTTYLYTSNCRRTRAKNDKEVAEIEKSIKK